MHGAADPDTQRLVTRALLRGSRTLCVLPTADYRLPADFALPTDMPCTSHTGNLPVLRRIHLHRIFRPCPRFPRQRTALPPMCRFRSLRLTRCRFANPPPASRRDARKFHRIGRPAAQIIVCRTSPPDFSRARPVHKTASPLAPPPFSPENGIFFCAPLFPVCRARACSNCSIDRSAFSRVRLLCIISPSKMFHVKHFLIPSVILFHVKHFCESPPLY